MRIASDWDGVIADTPDLKAQMTMLQYEIDIPPELFKRELVVPEHLTEREYDGLTRLVSMKPLGLTIKPVQGALEFIARLKSQGHEFSVVTSREEEFLETATELAGQYGLSLPFRGMGHNQSKAPALAGYDVFLDDDLDKLDDLEDIVPHRFLFSRGYNLNHSLPPGIIRVYSWRDFYWHLQHLSCMHAKIGC